MTKQMTTITSGLPKNFGEFEQKDIDLGFNHTDGFFSWFPYLIKNDGGEFLAVNQATEQQVEIGKKLTIIPLYSLQARKIYNGLASGLDVDKFDDWEEKDQETMAVTYGSINEKDPDFSLGSFTHAMQPDGQVKDYSDFLRDRDLGSQVRTRLYIAAYIIGSKVIPENQPVIFSFGASTIKTWNNYVKAIKTMGLVAPAMHCHLTLRSEKKKIRGKDKTFFRGLFEIMPDPSNESAPWLTGKNAAEVAERFFGVRDEINKMHKLLIASTENAPNASS